MVALLPPPPHYDPRHQLSGQLTKIEDKILYLTERRVGVSRTRRIVVMLKCQKLRYFNYLILYPACVGCSLTLCLITCVSGSQRSTNDTDTITMIIIKTTIFCVTLVCTYQWSVTINPVECRVTDKNSSIVRSPFCGDYWCWFFTLRHNYGIKDLSHAC